MFSLIIIIIIFFVKGETGASCHTLIQCLFFSVKVNFFVDT